MLSLTQKLTNLGQTGTETSQGLTVFDEYLSILPQSRCFEKRINISIIVSVMVSHVQTRINIFKTLILLLTHDLDLDKVSSLKKCCLDLLASGGQLLELQLLDKN